MTHAPPARNEWWQKPRLHRTSDSQEERRVGWIELFFDLVFVVVVSQLAHALAGEVTWRAVGTFALLFVPSWWLWIGMTFYAERFETMDVSHRLATFAAMLPVTALALFTHAGLPEGARGFALAYAAGRALIIAMWLRGGFHEPVARPMTHRFGVGFGASAALFVASVWVPAPWRYALWAVALCVDLLTPAVTFRTQRALPPFSSRIPERFGLFVLIVLGESIVSIVTGLAEAHPLTFRTVAAGGLGMALTFAFWWLYFDIISHRYARPGLGFGISRNYLHLPLVMSCTAMAAAVLNVVRHADEPLPGGVRALLCLSLAGACASIAALMSVVHPPSHPGAFRTMQRALLAVAAAAASMPLWGAALGALPVLSVLLGLLVALIALLATQWVRGQLG